MFALYHPAFQPGHLLSSFLTVFIDCYRCSFMSFPESNKPCRPFLLLWILATEPCFTTFAKLNIIFIKPAYDYSCVMIFSLSSILAGHHLKLTHRLVHQLACQLAYQLIHQNRLIHSAVFGHIRPFLLYISMMMVACCWLNQ